MNDENPRKKLVAPSSEELKLADKHFAEALARMKAVPPGERRLLDSPKFQGEVGNRIVGFAGDDDPEGE